MKVHMLIGMPASGKSTYGEKLAKERGAEYLSSDALREELFGDENHQGDVNIIFEELHRRSLKALQEKQEVVFDATNLNRKKRIHVITQVFKQYDVVAHVLFTPFEECLRRNKLRERFVSEDSIKRMCKNFQFPLLSEGFESIVYHHEIEEIPIKKSEIEKVLWSNGEYEEIWEVFLKVPYFDSIYELPQDSTYHTFSVSRHTFYVYKNVYERFENMTLELLYVAMFHDVGKAFCKSFVNYKDEKTRYANFIGHENVSALIAFHVLKNLGYDEEFIVRVCEIVSLHMMPKNAGKKALKKLKNWLSEEQHENLMLFNECDNEAK